MLCGHDGELRRYLYLDERGEWRRRAARSCFVCRLVVKNLDLHAVRSGRVCGLVRWLSDVTHSNESQGDSPNKIGVIGCARGCGGGGFVFYRRFGVSGACVPRSITMQRPTGTKDAGTPADSLSPSLESDRHRIP